MAELSLRSVTKKYSDVQVIHDVDLDIEPGEFTVFVGPSGCGKSTLLRMVAGLEEISGGELTIGGERMNEVDPSERGVAMVFQTYALYPHMSVAENMGFGLKMAKRPAEEIKQRVDEAAAILQLDKLLDRKPKALSGGQRQRVAIGRAIVRQPKVFLFDEPLSNLDAELRVAMRVEIARLHNELGATMIYVTHDQVEAMTLADRIVVLRDGRVEQVGSPLDLYDDPDNRFVAGFIGSPAMNFLDATVIGAEGQNLTVELSHYDGKQLTFSLTGNLPSKGSNISVGIRPEHFAEGGELGLPVTVDVVEHLGGESFIYTKPSGTDRVVAESREGRTIKTGDEVELRFSANHLMAFDQNGQRLR